jgi:hypothetical protein
MTFVETVFRPILLVLGQVLYLSQVVQGFLLEYFFLLLDHGILGVLKLEFESPI